MVVQVAAGVVGSHVQTSLVATLSMFVQVAAKVVPANSSLAATSPMIVRYVVKRVAKVVGMMKHVGITN